MGKLWINQYGGNIVGFGNQMDLHLDPAPAPLKTYITVHMVVAVITIIIQKKDKEKGGLKEKYIKKEEGENKIQKGAS